MNDLPRQKLCEIIAQHGRSLCHDPQRCKGLLLDFCGEYPKEITVLIGTMKEGIPAEILSSQNIIPTEVLLAQFTKRLQDHLALAEEAARWAVESWALALGVVTQAELVSMNSSPGQIPEEDRQEIIYQDSHSGSFLSKVSEQMDKVDKGTIVVLKNIFPQPENKTPENISRLVKANQQIKNASIAGIMFGVIILVSNTSLFLNGLLILGLTLGVYNNKSLVCAAIVFILSVITWFLLLGNWIRLIIAIGLMYFLFRGIEGTFIYHLNPKLNTAQDDT